MTSEFRARARKWLTENAKDLPSAAENPELAARQTQELLHRNGFTGITWPQAYGGQGLSAIEQGEWDEEAQAFDLPLQPLTIGLGMVGPILLDLGTEEQKQEFVRPLLTGAAIACQLFSEPGAGSDVASLRTRAVRDGDRWIINGQKVWTSQAQFADFGIVLARTNFEAPKHKGITMFVVDMRAPGVTVKPLRDMSDATDFSEVFFDDASLPVTAVVGEVDQGWAAAVGMLKHERVFIGNRRQSNDDASSAHALLALARESGQVKDPLVRRALGELLVSQRVCELFGQSVSRAVAAGLDPGPRGSIGKLANARHARQVALTIPLIAGRRATSWSDGDAGGAALARAVARAPRFGIAGGTDEIQRNIIGERVLGLPKES